MTLSTPSAASLAGLPDQSFTHEMGYRNVIDAQFVSRALETGARYIRGARWTTHALFEDDGEVIASAHFNYNRSFEALASIGGALAHVIRQGDTVVVRLAADSHFALDAAEGQLREQMPEHRSAANEVAVEFSHLSGAGGLIVTTRTLTVPTFSEIESNYPAQVRSALAGLSSEFRPGADGRLLLWHGLPGSGKTWALRALASEWRDWCKLRYITDPERLLAEPGYLIDVIHTRPDVSRDGEDWRLIVLEDTGELLAADAKQHAGQGLSRLLNVADGLLGESTNTFFLVTTNEDLRTIHPAVARPGRCAQVLEFDPLDADEANGWLAGQGSELSVATPTTLAELFAIRDGRDISPTRRRPVGFA